MGSMGTAKGFKVSGEFIYVFFHPFAKSRPLRSLFLAPADHGARSNSVAYVVCFAVATWWCGQMAMVRCSTRWQVVVPKLTAMELRMPALVKNQGSQTDLGDLRQFLSKSRALVHTNKSWTAGYTKEGDVKEGTTGDSGDRSKYCRC